MDQDPVRGIRMKRDAGSKEVFTTGEAAEVCQVSQQTIIRCFDAGRIRGFRVPGSRFRRIPREALIQFMKDNEIPLDRLASGKTRILIVDDDPEIVELFSDALKRDGRFEVRTAASGYDAGIATQEFSPDLIILDYMLPDINGNIVCRTIRQNPAFAHMRIIFVSGVVDRDEIEDLLRAGADDFVKKPFNMNDLIDKIAKMLGLSSPARTQ